MSKKAKAITSSKRKLKKIASSVDNNTVLPAQPEATVETQVTEQEKHSTASTTLAYIGTFNTPFFENTCNQLFLQYSKGHDPNVWIPLAQSIYQSGTPDNWKEELYLKRNKMRYIASQFLDTGNQTDNDPHAVTNNIYWLKQFLIMVIHDSEYIEAMLNNTVPNPDASYCFNTDRASLIQTASMISKATLEPVTYTETYQPDSLLAFCNTCCIPWLHFNPNTILSCNSTKTPENLPPLEYDWAFATPAYVKIFAQSIRTEIENWLFMDLIAVQHTHIYTDLCKAMETNEILPNDLIKVLKQKIKPDAAYMACQNAIFSHQAQIPLPHKHARFNQNTLYIVSNLYHLITHAAAHNRYLYILNI